MQRESFERQRDLWSPFGPVPRHSFWIGAFLGFFGFRVGCQALSAFRQSKSFFREIASGAR